MKIALFRENQFGYISSWHFPDYCEESDFSPSGWVRTSEWVEVDFPPLPPEVIIPAQLAALDQRKAEEVERHLRALADIADERGKLLALTQQGEAA